jgi:hypothetical protein
MLHALSAGVRLVAKNVAKPHSGDKCEKQCKIAQLTSHSRALVFQEFDSRLLKIAK